MNDKKLLSNPTKFGLAAFGIALLMLGFAYTGLIALNAVVYATILTMGVLAPLLAGIFEFVKGNSFRATSFILFSLFFLTFYIFSTRTLGAVAANRITLGIFYLAWSLVIGIMFCGTIFKKMGAKMIMIQIILGTFMLFVLLLGIAQLANVNALFITSGVLALICAAAIFIDFIMHICTRVKKDSQIILNNPEH